jgi:hypothetical protein
MKTAYFPQEKNVFMIAMLFISHQIVTSTYSLNTIARLLTLEMSNVYLHSLRTVADHILLLTGK